MPQLEKLDSAISCEIMQAHEMLTQSDLRMRDLCRASAVSAYEWKPAQNQAGALDELTEGEAGGLFVYSPTLSQRAYMKPRKLAESETQQRAAREKIAADLAAELGVSVPPVMLTTRDGAPAGEESAVCVSMVMRARQWSWDQVKDHLERGGALSKELLRCLPHQAAAAFAFDTWVGQPDHDDHPHNIVLGYSEQLTDFTMIFLDYAMAFGFGGVWQVGAAPFPPAMLKWLDKRTLDVYLGKIEQFPPDLIAEIVHRIPEHYLGPSEATKIAATLTARRSTIRAALVAHS